MIAIRPFFAALAAASALVPASHAQTTPSNTSSTSNGLGGGSLANLGMPREGRLAHYSSRELNGGNADFRPIAPGATFTLLDHQGAGIVRRWWLTIAPWNNREIQRQLIVRCYWDGEATPSVEVPVADFFGVGFGEWHQFQSLPLNMTSGGYNCYWPMPFGRRARITVENRSKVPVQSFYYNVDIETRPRVDNQLYFHAQFRRATTERGRPYTLLEATGRGHYVGTLLSMQNVRSRGLGFLEGDERVFVDGEREPSVIGTGTEDYFSSGWYYNTGPYSAPYHGITIKDEVQRRVSTYRWHIEDPIPFTRSLRFDIEHGGVNDSPGADYTSVAFWYQTHPHAPFPPLPANLLPVENAPIFRIANVIEGESLRASARATSGSISSQGMTAFNGQWSDEEQLWWQPARAGERLTLTLNAPTAGEYELVGYFTRADDYGDARLIVNGRPLAQIARGYATAVSPTGPVSFGRVPMRAGANEVVVEVAGKDPLSKGFLIGVDGFVLKP